MKSRHILIGLVVLGLALLLAACAQTPAPTEPPTPCPTAPPCPECPAPPEPEPCPEPVVKDVPFEAQWVASPHNDAEAEAFVHWNEDDPKEVPTSCATCHSSSGYQDFLGADGSAAGTVEKGVPVGETIQCVTCHNAATATLSSVTFPSGAVVEGLGAEARCMVCHQGRASMVQVDAALEKNGLLEDLDKAVPELGFVNIHYYAAGATLYGGVTMGGYQYEGKMYDAKFRHVEGYDSCVGCHSPHTTELKIDECAACHEGVAAKEDLKKVRMQGSLTDYDGDGNVEEGIAEELDGMRALLFTAIQSYATEVSAAPIGYNAAAYPYFFADPNGDGEISEDEAISDNAYKSWTGRLERAAYNYQVSLKDPGAYAHGGKYILQLLYDSIEDLNGVLATPVDLAAVHREDAGHFAGNTEAFRHWDEDGEVPGGCAKCHSADGLPTFIKNNANVATHISNGFMCTTCHNEAEWPALFSVAEVTFPSGAKLSFGEAEKGEANLCLVCHQGRSSTATVNRALADKAADTVDEKIGFSNIHYFAAGATLFGTEAQGAYEFQGKEYVGKHPHVENGFDCKSCHDVHALEVKVETCATCHAKATDPSNPETIRFNETDWDGDGDVTEGVKAEIATFGERLYAGIQAYAADKGTAIVYDSHNHPYFFVADANEEVALDDKGARVRYAAFTPNLMRAAFNYQYWQKDPGNYAHNAKYMLQVLYDSIQAVKGDVAGLTRP